MGQSHESSELQKPTSHHDSTSNSFLGTNPRFEAARVLLDHGISCSIWAEDALQEYGARTVSFDLFLIVENPDEAGKCLQSCGYSRALPNPCYRFIEELQALPRFIKGPFSDVEDDYGIYVALVKAQYVRFSLPPPSIANLFPPLPVLIDSIIDAWLDAPTTAYAMHLKCHLAYLQDYCPRAKDPLLANQLKLGHRDFYLRSLSGPGIGAERDKWRQVRDSFLETIT